MCVSWAEIHYLQLSSTHESGQQDHGPGYTLIMVDLT